MVFRHVRRTLAIGFVAVVAYGQYFFSGVPRVVAPATGCDAITQTDLDICVELNEGTGTAATDSSGNGNNGTFGVSTADPAWTTDGGENVIAFDSDDYISFGNILNRAHDEAFSLFAVVKPGSVTGAGDFFSKDAASGSFEGYLLSRSDTQVVAFLINTYGSNFLQEVQTIGTLSTSAYSVIGFTKGTGTTNTALKIYVNGAEVATTVIADTLTDTMSNSVNLSLGARATSSFGTSGNIAGGWTHSKELSSVEVLADYCAFRAFKPGLSLPAGSCP